MCPKSARLAAVDEANLVLDHAGQVNVFLCAGLLDPGGFVSPHGKPDLHALRNALRERIAAIPELCRIPAGRGRRHYWVKVSPELEHHIRLIHHVEGLEGLEKICGDFMCRAIALDRPPWELLVVPGVSARTVGIVLRIHHSVADGIAAVAIAQQLFGGIEGAPMGIHGTAEPAKIRPVTMAGSSQHGLRVLHYVSRIGFSLHRLLTTIFGRGIGPTALLGDRTPQRGVAFVDTDLQSLEMRLRPLGATINDALLSAAASGYAAMLPAINEPIPEEIPVSIPVALRRHGTSRNQVGVMLVRLPLGVREPDARVRLIAERTRREKDRARQQGTLEFMRGPLGACIMDKVVRRQHAVAGFMTNVPGPSTPMVLAGAPVVAIWPVGVLAGNVRLGVAAVSYAGTLWCGVHFDQASLPGAVFAQAMSEEFRRLTTLPT